MLVPLEETASSAETSLQLWPRFPENPYPGLE
jgi:hypothetical protein